MGKFDHDELEWKCEFIKNDDKTWTWSVVRDRHIYETSISTTLNEAREVAFKAMDKHKKAFEKGEKRVKGKSSTSSAQRGTGAGGTPEVREAEQSGSSEGDQSV